MKKIALFLLFVMYCNRILAQDKVTSFGIIYKPIFPSQYFRTGPKYYSDKGIDFSLLQKSGMGIGALVRRGIGNKLAFESGIQYTKRNYDFSLRDSSFLGEGSVKIIGYEIPVSCLVFLQLGNQLYMNTALGASLDIFPSDVVTNDPNDEYYLFYAARTHLSTFAIHANVGFEYRTKKSGILYFGANYHRSLSPIFRAINEYYPTRDYDRLPTATGVTELSSDYFTIDFRYYFHEEKFKREKTQEYRRKMD